MSNILKLAFIASALSLSVSAASAQEPVQLPSDQYVRCYMPVFGFLPNCEVKVSLGGGGGAKAEDYHVISTETVTVDCPEPEYTETFRRGRFVSVDPYRCATCTREQTTAVLDGRTFTYYNKGPVTVTYPTKNYGWKGQARSVSLTATSGLPGKEAATNGTGGGQGAGGTGGAKK